MIIADIGGRGYIQDVIVKKFGIDVLGLYYSVRNDDLSMQGKEGLVFTLCPKRNIVSSYAYILRCDLKMAEELSMEGDGSVTHIELDDGGIPLFCREWNAADKQFYYDYVSKVQPEIETEVVSLFQSTSSLGKKAFLRKCAFHTLFNSLFRSSSYIQMQESYNCGDDTALPGYNEIQNPRRSYKDFPWSWRMIWAPEEYLSYYTHIQPLVWNHILLRLPYLVLAFFLFAYIWIVSNLKELWRGK